MLDATFPDIQESIISLRLWSKLKVMNYFRMICEQANDVEIIIVFSEGVHRNFTESQPRKIGQVLPKKHSFRSLFQKREFILLILLTCMVGKIGR